MADQMNFNMASDASTFLILPSSLLLSFSLPPIHPPTLPPHTSPKARRLHIISESNTLMYIDSSTANFYLQQNSYYASSWQQQVRTNHTCKYSSLNMAISINKASQNPNIA